MLSLQALSNWELAVLESISGASGSIEERDAQITRSGMYAEYPAIFSSYLQLARDAADESMALEALKRAVFIAWYSFVELPIVSGIGELPESGVRELMDLLGTAIDRGTADNELQVMLAWYVETFPHPFELYGRIRSLDDFVAQIRPEDVRRRAADLDLASRGQLGLYWKAVAAAA